VTRSARRAGRRLGAAAVALLLAWVAAGCDPSGRGAAGSGAERRAARAAWLDDGALHVVLCGTGSGLPARERAGPCTAVMAGGRLLVIDAGPGSWENVALWGLPQEALAGVLLTRLDASHIADLGEAWIASWRAGRSLPLPVHGPPEVGRVVAGLEEAYGPDVGARIARHGPEAMPPEGARMEARPLVALRDPEAVVDADGLRVLAFPMPGDEGGRTVGYRIEFAGRVVVVCGAVTGSRALRAHVAGTELLVHEAQASHLVEGRADALAEAGEARSAALLRDTLGARASPAQAVALAREIGARRLVLTHLAPPLDSPKPVRAFLRGATEGWEGALVLGEDGMHFALPAGSSEIREEEVDDP
jgi:ribonuclease Z